ncbi:hypothetical protein AGOR_G00045870 [Albula goreensis]|uniref:non-specific serine/threonine protein kinase n=1 Tax=Albula goreensis TaxID=1534307 RepID=A0A8T3DVQ2_9TELE|nr:hypothetical protein AGOR_G00045870 [Albula goreensis]
MELQSKSRKSWIEETFCKRECVRFIPASRDLHRCTPVCQVCQNLIRCCCGRLIGEHAALDRAPPPSPQGQSSEPEALEDEEWSVDRHTQASPTDAFGTIDFQDGPRSCRAKYVRLSCDDRPEQVLQLMLKEWQMEMPKLVLSVHGGTDNFLLTPKVRQNLSRGLVRAAESTGAWVLTDGINTGVSRCVGDAVKLYGNHAARKRYMVGITPWGVIENQSDLLGRDVIRPYQMVGNPLSKRSCLNSLHSTPTAGGRRHCREAGRPGRAPSQAGDTAAAAEDTPQVPLVAIVVEGGPGLVPLVLRYVRSAPPVPVVVFEGTGRIADLLAFIHKQTTDNRQLEADIREDFLVRIQHTFSLGKSQSCQLYDLLTDCMDYRDSITIFDSESVDQQESDTAILTALFKGTKVPAPDQLNITLAWDREDIAKKHVLVYGQHWKVGSLEQAMLDALVMDRVGFVKLLIENGMTMNRFLTMPRLEELYNTLGSANNLLYHLVEDVKQSHLPIGYRVSLIDVGLVIEYLIGGAYRSTYTRKHFRATYNHQRKEGNREGVGLFNMMPKAPSMQRENQASSPPRPHFFRTAQPYKRKEKNFFAPKSRVTKKAEQSGHPVSLHNFNDLFVWAVLMKRQQMALFLWQHGEEAMARAVVACKLYRTMAHEAKQGNMGDSVADELKTYSLEFGQLAVDLLDSAFRQNERMAMKLLTYEMSDWSNFTCLQMAVSSGLRPFVAHSCTQMLLTDLWMGRLNMRKNSWFKIILSILVPPAIFLLEFKSKAEMSHVPRPQESPQFSLETPGGAGAGDSGRVGLIAYLGFLMLYSYTVLVKMSPTPSPQEWPVILYILSTTVEKVREVLISEPRKLNKKLKLWFGEYWNAADFVAIVLFLVGLGLRWYGAPFRTAAHIVYSLDIIFWYVRLLDLFAVNQHVGPYLTMITKMTSNMFYIVVMMAIVLLSFGVSRKAILSPDEPPSWTLARDVVFQPYWMIFGEVYADEIDACANNKTCPPGSFITPWLQAVYLFFQYIIMVNILIAFFNNIYFDMKSISDKLWKYNRYRYIMTYQEKPRLPPPFILFSHVTLLLSSIHQWQSRKPEQEVGSGLKLYLCQEDLKKLHDFEEQCVAEYYHQKSKSLCSSQETRIKSTNETTEEMSVQLQEVGEKVQAVRTTLQSLDVQLGQLQDMSALVVDTLAVATATDSLQVGDALLGHRRPLGGSRCRLPHSWSHVGHGTASHVTADGLCLSQHHSTPPSLLRRVVTHGDRRPSLNRREWGSMGLETSPPAVTPLVSLRHAVVFCPGGGEGVQSQGIPHPLCASDPPEHFYTRAWIHESPLPPNQEEEDGEEVEGDIEDEPEQDLSISRASSHALLLPDYCIERGGAGGVVNPAFSMDREHGAVWLWRGPLARMCCELPMVLPRQCRSLSTSLESIGHAPKTLCSPAHDSLPDTPLDSARLKELSKSSEMYLSKKPKSQSRKTVKIQESDSNISGARGTEGSLQGTLAPLDPCRKRQLQGEDKVFGSSASLRQQNFLQMDLMQKCGISCQDSLGAVSSVWSSWAKSQSRRSSVQSLTGLETKSSTFQTSEDLVPHYSAVERNNLMRLANTIPFTPIPPLAGEEVSIYRLEETTETGASSWSQQGLTALLQPLAWEGEGEGMDGGLRQATLVLCTWAEGGVLETGDVYIVKAFRPEVIKTWQRVFHRDTPLHLCLREIQQQRAAQKLMQIFNQIKPESIPYSPRFLDVLLLHWRSQDRWLTIERNMGRDFRKYNNSTGEETPPGGMLEEVVLAFSHWTYHYSLGELLVLDLQGVGLDLTDPSVIKSDGKGSPGDMVFGPDNHGDRAIQSFIQKHTCNTCCAKLGLSDLRRSNISPGKLNPAFEEDGVVIVTKL